MGQKEIMHFTTVILALYTVLITASITLLSIEEVSPDRIMKSFSDLSRTQCQLRCIRENGCVSTAMKQDLKIGDTGLCYLLRKEEVSPPEESSMKMLVAEKNTCKVGFPGDQCGEVLGDETCNSDSDCDANSQCLSYKGKKKCVCVCGYTKRGSTCQRDDLSEPFKQNRLELFSKKCTPRKNNEIGVLPKIGKEYRINFDVYASVFVKSWPSIIHLSTGTGDIADRILAVWFDARSSTDTDLDTGTKCLLYIASYVNNNHAYNYQSKPYAVNQWINVEIYQQMMGNDYTYFIKLDSLEVHKVINTTPREISNVKVYVGEPEYIDLKGFIRNFAVESK